MNAAVRRTAAAILLLALLAAAVLALAACGADDPFVGVYWEPATSRRVEIKKEDDLYWFYYGAQRRPYEATRVGDELQIRDPMGATILVKTSGGEGLELVIGSTTTRLKPLPQR